jgi:hypothetical protein
MKTKSAILAVGATAYLAFIIVPFSAGLVGCGKNQCEALKDSCAACSEPGKSACTALVNANVQDACKAAVDGKQYDANGPACKAVEIPGGTGGGGG